jgi:acyl-[acyl-carrier-protein] desaturase
VDDIRLLRELEPVVERLLERHLETAREWFPHQHVPYGRGRDFDAEHAWSVESADLGGATIDEAVRSALIVNLLTEDNLPYYFRTIERQLGADGAWGVWTKRWTAEEGRHSMAIYGYLMVTRAVDPLAYVALQELATRIAHRNTGRMLGDSAGYDVMMRVAADENLHHLFYRDLTRAALEVDPSTAVQAIERQVVGFEMPGTGIPGFAAHAAAIAKAGIYDLSIHYDQILCPVVLRQWELASVSGLDAEAERARERLMARLAKNERVARRITDRRAETAAMAH